MPTNDPIPRMDVGAWLQAKANKLDANGLEPNSTAEVVHELASIVYNGLDLLVEARRMQREADGAVVRNRDAGEMWAHTSGVNP
jgi:hypothetical protein